MESCLFCQIANNSIQSHKIWEDEEYLAFLDIYPNTEGMTVVIPKKHFDSDMFDLDDKNMCELIKAGKKVVKRIKKGLGVDRIALVMEGLGINHLHLKLYPLWGIEDKFVETWSKEVIYYEKYLGYISTQPGPKKSDDELNGVANKIKNI